MKKVTAAQVVTPDEAAKEELPDAVQVALGDLAGAAKEGLLALSVGLGLGVVHELMAAEVEEVCGPKGKQLGEAKRSGQLEAELRRLSFVPLPVVDLRRQSTRSDTSPSTPRPPT